MKLVALGILLSMRGVALECPANPLSEEQAIARFHELDKKAQVEFRRGDLAAAAEDFRHGACVAPENLRSYYELYGIAIGAAAGGDFDRARQVLQQADALRPNYPLPLAMLVKVNLTYRDTGRVKESLRAAAQRFPLDGRLHAEFVKDLLHQQLQDLALAEALRFEQSGNQDVEDTVTLAVLENNAGAFGDAIRHAVAIEEKSALPNEARASGAAVAGLAYENLGQFAEAEQHLKRATEFAPVREQPYLDLARIYERQQKAKAAVEILELGCKQLPNSPKLLMALGSSLVSAGQYPAAAKVLVGLVQSSAGLWDAYPKLAEAYREMGDAGRAAATLKILAQRKADYPMLHIIIAQSMLNADPVNYPGVLDELAQAEKVSPTDYDVYYLRGKAYLAMNNYHEAIAALRYAIALRPAEPGAYYQLGLAYRKSGQNALAKEQFDRVEYLKSQPARP